MGHVRSSLGGCALAFTALLLTAAPGKAAITFCNDFQRTVFVAIAYQQADQSWLSRGWLEVKTGKCYPFDTALNIASFYYRGDTGWYRTSGRKKERYVWKHDERRFAILDDSNFQFWDAERKVLNSHLDGFAPCPISSSGGVTVTVTFQADGQTVNFKSTQP